MNVQVNELTQRLPAALAAAATPIDFNELEQIGVLKAADDGWYVLVEPGRLPAWAWTQLTTIQEGRQVGGVMVKFDQSKPASTASAVIDAPPANTAPRCDCPAMAVPHIHDAAGPLALSDVQLAERAAAAMPIDCSELERLGILKRAEHGWHELVRPKVLPAAAWKQLRQVTEDDVQRELAAIREGRLVRSH